MLCYSYLLLDFNFYQWGLDLYKVHKVKQNVPAIICSIRAGPVNLVQMLVNTAVLFVQVCCGSNWTMADFVLWEVWCNTSRTECWRRSLWTHHQPCFDASQTRSQLWIFQLQFWFLNFQRQWELFGWHCRKVDFFFSVSWVVMTQIWNIIQVHKVFLALMT